MKKLEKKQKKSSKQNLFVFIVFSLFIYSFQNGEELFWSGFHNIDLSYNTRVFVEIVQPYIDERYEFTTDNIADQGTRGIIKSHDEWYSLGLDQIKKSKTFFLIAGVSLFALLILLIEKKKSGG